MELKHGDLPAHAPDNPNTKKIFIFVIIIIIASIYFGIIRDSWIVRKTKIELVKDLLDPDSAKIRNIRRVLIKGETVVCGEINAKNAYGAYTGFKEFKSLKAGNSVLVLYAGCN